MHLYTVVVRQEIVLPRVCCCPEDCEMVFSPRKDYYYCHSLTQCNCCVMTADRRLIRVTGEMFATLQGLLNFYGATLASHESDLSGLKHQQCVYVFG